VTERKRHLSLFFLEVRVERGTHKSFTKPQEGISMGEVCFAGYFLLQRVIVLLGHKNTPAPFYDPFYTPVQPNGRYTNNDELINNIPIIDCQLFISGLVGMRVVFECLVTGNSSI